MNIRNTILTCFVWLLMLPTQGAVIHWFSDSTDTTTLPSNFVFAVESPGPPQGYRSVRWGTMLKLLGTSTNYLQNLYITSNYVTYLTVQSNAVFNTDLTVYSNSYFYGRTIIEQNITTNLTVYSNALFYGDTYIDNSITTNLTVYSNAYFQQDITVESNTFLTEVFVNVETITNNLHVVTNSWDGPTNPLPMFYAWQAYRAFTPCEITGITGKSNYVTSATLLSITNASDSNITLYLPADVRTGDGARSYIITNAEVGKLSVEYDPNGATNAVYRMFY